MMASLEELLIALGLKLKTLVAAAVGAFVSLRFFDGLSFAERWLTFMGGWAIGAYIAEPLTEFFELNAKIEVGLALLAALFGMSLAAAVIRAIRETKWSDLTTFWRGGK